jgi:hypothetical protein
MPDDLLNCDIPAELIRFDLPLINLATQFDRKRPVKIVAIGSSSTEGDGASSQAFSYPSRLEAALRLRLPDQEIAVLNKGKGGEEASDELLRFNRDVLSETPSLVIWQVGTNAAWKGYDLASVAKAIDTGLAGLRDLAMDVVLMDLQYAPAVLKPATIAATKRMVALIADAAAKANVNVFCRFALMRHWNLDDHIPFDKMISNFDGNELHQNDWSYNCIAEALSVAITGAATGQTRSAAR